MKDKDFGAAIWAFSWDQIYESEASCEQGSVGLADGKVLLEVPFGELLGERDVDASANGDKRPNEVDFLYGFTQRGRYVVLKDAWYEGGVRSTPGGDSQRIRAKYLLTSRKQFDPSALITKVELSIYGLNEWASIFPATAMHDRSTNMLKRVDIELSEQHNKTLLDNERMSVTLFHKLKTSPLTIEGISVTHDCGLLIKLAHPCSLDSAVSIVRSICSFFSFCNDSFAELLTLDFSIEDAEAPVSCLGSFESVPFERRSLKADDVTYPLDFFGPSVGTVLDRWINAEGRLATARDIVTTLSIGTWLMPLDLAFATIAQVLESLSKHNVDAHALPDEKYRSFRKTVLEGISDPEIKEWAEIRLNGNNKGQKRLLKEFLETNHDVLGWTIEEYQDTFVDSHIATRNYYVHRGESKKEMRKVLQGEELYWHTWNCVLVCRLVIAKYMGFDATALVKVTKKSARWSRVRDKALDNYASHSS